MHTYQHHFIDTMLLQHMSALKGTIFREWDWCTATAGSTKHVRYLLWVRIPPGAWMFVCCGCCVLSGRGLCDKLITHPEESYWLWCVVVCDLENLKNEEAMTHVGSQHHRKKKYKDVFIKPTFNPLKTKRRLLYLKTQFVPRCKHFSSRL